MNLKPIKGTISKSFSHKAFVRWGIEIELDTIELEGFQFSPLLVLDDLQLEITVNDELESVSDFNELESKRFDFKNENQNYFGGLFCTHSFFVETPLGSQIEIEQTYDCAIKVESIFFEELKGNLITAKLEFELDFSLFYVAELPIDVKNYPAFKVSLEATMSFE
ncbi:MAG: hypothetical protein AB8B69_22610 [Chitinophagales bacterium]